MPEFTSKISIDAPREFAFHWHENPHALERLTPPWEKIRLVEKSGSIDTGFVALQTRVWPFWIGMRAQHSQFIRNEQFYDEMSGGPFRSWQHWHRFESEVDQTKLVDEIHYRLRGGFLGQWLAGGFVKRRLQQMFAYRRQVTKTDIEDHFSFQGQSPKTIAVTGATGLVGKALCQFLIGGGHRVIPLSRVGDSSISSETGWNPNTGEVNFGSDIQQVDSFIHLAGYGIATRRWNAAVKQRIRDSRVEPTEKLAQFLAQRNLVRESFVGASATGFYGDRKDEPLNENAKRGEGFLADICEPWELACRPLDEAGIRTVNMRFGMIISAKGGALPPILPPFNFGAGGKIGHGNQYWSWISLYDTIRAIHFTVCQEKLTGPVNFTAPNPVTQRQFAKILGKVLFRPSFFPLPAFAAKMVLGEMAEYLLLASTNAIPAKLDDCGFRFVHNTLEEAFRFELGRMKLHSKDES